MRRNYLFFKYVLLSRILFLTGPDLVLLHITKSIRIIFAQNSAQTVARGRLQWGAVM